MSVITLSAACFLLFTAAGVIWLNPRRFSNQVFSVVSIILALFLWCVYQAMEAGVVIAHAGNADLEFWLRNTGLVAAFLPGSIWLQMTATIEGGSQKRVITGRALPWLALAAFLCFLTFQDSFAAKGSDGRLIRGQAYILYTTIAIVAFSICFYQAYRKLPKLTGIRRTELQFLSFSIGLAALFLGLFNTLGNILDLRALNRSSIVIVFAAYVIVACALIFHRVFNARQIFAFLSQKTILIVLLCAGIIYIPQHLTSLVSDATSQVISILGCSAGIIWLNKVSRRWLKIDDDLILADARRAVIDLALKESNTDKRRGACERLLLDHFAASDIIVHSDDESEQARRPFTLSPSRPAYQTLCKTGWATPESLQRQRSSPASKELRDFLVGHCLGVIVTVPRGSLQPSLIVALGTKINDAPFTYPEVTRLQNIAELMDNILTRSRLTTQAALQAKMEHLAMMSRGLAHDLKNLITPISSYLVHTESSHAPGTLAAEVYSSAQRSVSVMNDYVREALFFSERMEPKYESVNLKRIFSEVRAITASRAQQAGVLVTTELATIDSLKADGVLLQRMLANLVANAIDASPSGRTVAIRGAPRSQGWIRLQVVDEGCGIPAEHLERIFDPYFTTKEFGETVRGFGLGLTITQKIVNLHHGKISVQSSPGKGATITIDLPGSPPAAPNL